MIKIAIFSAIINLVDYDLPFLILSTKRFDVHMDQEMRHKRKYLDPKRIYSLRFLVQSTQEAELVNGKWRLSTLVLTYSRFVLFTDQYTFVHLSCSGV